MTTDVTVAVHFRTCVSLYCVGASIAAGCAVHPDDQDSKLPAPSEEIQLIEEIRVSASDPDSPLIGYPGRVDVDERGFMYVTDWREKTVWVLDPDGNHIRNIGSQGEGPGQFRTAPGVTYIEGDSVIVFGQQGLDVFDRNTGEYRQRHSFPASVAGRVWLILARSYPEHVVLLENEVFRVAVDGDSAEKLLTLPAHGRITADDGFWERASFNRIPWCSSTATKIYCGFSEDLRFVVMSAATGDSLGTINVEFEPLQISGSERADILDRYKGTRYAKRLEIPETWPAYRETLGDDRERLWITLRTRHDEVETILWVVDPASNTSSYAAVAGDLYASSVRNGKLYGTLTDTDGDVSVVRYGIRE